MSDKPISVGDLVMVVRGCGCRSGRIYCVIENCPDSRGWICRITPDLGIGCGTILPPCVLVRVQNVLGKGYFPRQWLRRIPPLSELDSVEHKQEQPA